MVRGCEKYGSKASDCYRIWIPGDRILEPDAAFPGKLDVASDAIEIASTVNFFDFPIGNAIIKA